MKIQKKVPIGVGFTDKSRDAGDIMLQSKCEIAKTDNIKSLWFDKLAPLGVELLTLAVDLLSRGYVLRSPQQ